MDVPVEPYQLILAGRLIDGLGGPPVPDGAVLVRGSRVVASGPRKRVAAPEGAPLLVHDFSSKTVMPGMVDCHTHHNGFGDGRVGDDLARLPDEVLTLQSARDARTSLLSGVTTIRENGSKNATTLRLRDAIREGRETGPWMVLSGRPVSIIGGHMGYFGSEVTGPVEARAMVRRLVKEGADYIKITATGGSTRTSFPLLPAFDVDELGAIVDEAHNLGRLTAAHCTSTRGTINSLDAGVDMIIHCVFKDEDGNDEFREDVAERIGELGAFVNPTLHVGRSGIWELQHRKAEKGLGPLEQRRLDHDLRQFEVRMEHSRRLIDLGLRVVTGSDSSWGAYKLGNTVHETECLVMAGYSPMQAVLSVTRDAAESLGMGDTVGALEPGKEADIIALDGDPSEDVGALWTVTDVMLAGRFVDRGSPGPLAATRQRRPD